MPAGSASTRRTGGKHLALRGTRSRSAEQKTAAQRREKGRYDSNHVRRSGQPGLLRSAAVATRHAGRNPVMGVTSLPAGLSRLAGEFPGYEFGLQRSWDGNSFVAVRSHGSARPGLYAVITADLDELRRALVEGERPGHKQHDMNEGRGT